MMEQPTDGIVTLTDFAPSDANVLYEVDHDPEHRLRFDFPGTFIPSLRHSLDTIARWDQERAAGERYGFAVRDASSGALLGGVELRPLDHEVANVSYWTYPLHRCRGIASRGLALACKLAFKQFGFRRVEAAIDPDNVASQRVARRNRFRLVGEREGRILYVLDAVEVRGAPDIDRPTGA
jgi:RimJ/RimL family protein N-acetyltransferase